MQVLKILSEMWKAGAEIYRDPNDRQLVLKNHEKIPKEIMDAAEKVFPQIDEWFKSWENESKVNITMRKILHLFCGWQSNDVLNKWLCAEIEYLHKFDDWLKMLDRNGWNDIYEDFRQFQTDESNKLAQEIYERAIVYAKGVKTH